MQYHAKWITCTSRTYSLDSPVAHVVPVQPDVQLHTAEPIGVSKHVPLFEHVQSIIYGNHGVIISSFGRYIQIPILINVNMPYQSNMAICIQYIYICVQRNGTNMSRTFQSSLGCSHRTHTDTLKASTKNHFEFLWNHILGYVKKPFRIHHSTMWLILSEIIILYAIIYLHKERTLYL